MSEAMFRALVVDDELIVRQMVSFALAREGFLCDQAVDGNDALQKLEHGPYDLVITDLRMPNKHGHALIVDLLARPSQPLLVVHSSVDDPRMTKDLMLRGVDDIIYKPANYAAFAAKARILTIRRRHHAPRLTHQSASPVSPAVAISAAEPPASPPPQVTAKARHAPIAPQDFDQQLARVAHILPVSEVAVEVLDRLRGDNFDVHELSESIQRDAVLSAELLRIANSACFNHTVSRTADLHEAMLRVGTKRVGEIAVAVSALGCLTTTVVPWFDKTLAWQRSVAGGMAATRLLECRGENHVDDGIVFSALMYPLSRVILGTAFPDVYRTWLDELRHTPRKLLELERETFPHTPAAATVQLLSRWGLPSGLCAPLFHADASFTELAELPTPIGRSVQLLKTALSVAELAVGRWLPWESAESPSEELLAELGVVSPADLIAAVRDDMVSLGTSDAHAPPVRFDIEHDGALAGLPAAKT